MLVSCDTLPSRNRSVFAFSFACADDVISWLRLRWLITNIHKLTYAQVSIVDRRCCGLFSITNNMTNRISSFIKYVHVDGKPSFNLQISFGIRRSSRVCLILFAQRLEGASVNRIINVFNIIFEFFIFFIFFTSLNSLFFYLSLHFIVFECWKLTTC